MISIGDHKTRKKDVLEKIFRQQLTAKAMKKVEKKREIGKTTSGTESSNDNEDQMWDAVDEEAEEIERGERNGNIVLGPLSERSETELETVTSTASSAPEVSYMPIQTGLRPQMPSITTTSTTSSDGMSTTTTTTVR